MTASILVCGAGGQVGQALCATPSIHQVIGYTSSDLDITDGSSVRLVCDDIKPAIIINAAAYTQVDAAERDPGLAFAVNRDGVISLAKACRDRTIPLLHISTDYVFDGDKSGAWVETDLIGPLGVYGQSKADGENELRAILEEHIILRTSWVFSETGNNFVKTMIRLGKERDVLGIVNDQYGCPTSARTIAEVLLRIADRYLSGQPLEWGIYHYCNSPATTWYYFAREIFKQAGYEDVKVDPILTNAYPTPAMRPKNSVLDCAKIERLGIEQVCWKDELKRIL